MYGPSAARGETPTRQRWPVPRSQASASSSPSSRPGRSPSIPPK
ncbi:MAG TPA: hypothetical protein VGM69_04210 [Chloroflexota bacterium]